VAPVYKLSTSRLSSRTSYSSMLAGNPVYVVPTDFESIATTTVGSGGAANVEFTSIPGTYKHLQIRSLAQTNRSGIGRDIVNININNDTGSNYARHYLSGDGASAVAGGSISLTKGELTEVGTTAGASFGAIVVDLLDYANTDKHKTIRSLGGVDVNGTVGGYGGTINLYSTLWRSTSAITSIKLVPLNGTQFNQHSTFALYGIKGA
jgi:hypothetical protein